MKRIYYIAGPMTGIPNYNRTAFYRAELDLKRRFSDSVILNPAIHPDGLEHAEYMMLCRPMVEIATHLYMLRGWENSKGANIEYRWALNYNKVIEQETGKLSDSNGLTAILT